MVPRLCQNGCAFAYPLKGKHTLAESKEGLLHSMNRPRRVEERDLETIGLSSFPVPGVAMHNGGPDPDRAGCKDARQPAQILKELFDLVARHTDNTGDHIA